MAEDILPTGVYAICGLTGLAVVASAVYDELRFRGWRRSTAGGVSIASSPVVVVIVIAVGTLWLVLGAIYFVLSSDD